MTASGVSLTSKSIETGPRSKKKTGKSQAVLDDGCITPDKNGNRI